MANKALILPLAVKAVNDTAGPTGLVPTLPVVGAYPRLSDSDPPSPTITQRASAVKKVMHELSKIQTTRQVKVLRQRNGLCVDT
jgi:hypothetical protein